MKSRPAGSTSSRESLLVPRFLSLLLGCLVGRPAPALAQIELQAFLGTAIESVVIPVVPIVEVTQTAVDSAEGDPPD